MRAHERRRETRSVQNSPSSFASLFTLNVLNEFSFLFLLKHNDDGALGCLLFFLLSSSRVKFVPPKGFARTAARRVDRPCGRCGARFVLDDLLDDDDDDDDDASNFPVVDVGSSMSSIRSSVFLSFFFCGRENGREVFYYYICGSSRRSKKVRRVILWSPTLLIHLRRIKFWWDFFERDIRGGCFFLSHLFFFFDLSFIQERKKEREQKKSEKKTVVAKDLHSR